MFSDPIKRFDPFVIRGRRIVTLSPDVAVVTGNRRITSSTKDGPFKEHFRYLDTFARRGGGWRVDYVQVTKLP